MNTLNKYVDFGSSPIQGDDKYFLDMNGFPPLVRTRYQLAVVIHNFPRENKIQNELRNNKGTHSTK